MKSILLSWIGGHDFKYQNSDESRLGPIASILRHQQSQIKRPFDEIFLLCDTRHYDRDGVIRPYFQRLTAAFPGHFHLECLDDIIDPSDFTLIYNHVDELIGKIKNLYPHHKIKWHFNTTSGTNAMSSIWILLGKTQYPAILYHTWVMESDGGQSHVGEYQIPFRLSLESLSLDADPAGLDDTFLSTHPKMKSLQNMARLLAPFNDPVLLLGETGTGKEVFARMIYRNSGRSDKKFYAVNCAAITPTLLESELFGHEKGAFTGADTMKKGYFEICHGGTIFLDEIAEMSPEGQTKLLRVLQEKVLTRVGGTEEIPIDVRIIAATNREPFEAIAQKQLREDLFYRLAVGMLNLPPLRERAQDIITLARHFLKKYNKSCGRKFPAFNLEYRSKKLDDSAEQALMKHNWPGNIRELENTVHRLCITNPEREWLTAQEVELAIIRPPSNNQPELRKNHPIPTPGHGAHSFAQTLSNPAESDLRLPFPPDIKVLLDPHRSFNLRQELSKLEHATIRQAKIIHRHNKNKTARYLGYDHYQTMDNRLRHSGFNKPADPPFDPLNPCNPDNPNDR